MPIAEVQFPDGRIGQFEVPETATPAEIEAFAHSQINPIGQNSPEDIAQKNAALEKQLASQPTQNGMAENLGRGLIQGGKSAVTGALGLGSDILGKIYPESKGIQSFRELLPEAQARSNIQYQANTGNSLAAGAGNIIGQAAPYALLPASAATLGGRVGLGALGGAIGGATQSNEKFMSPDDAIRARIMDATIGAGMGAAIPGTIGLAGKAMTPKVPVPTYEAVKNLSQALYKRAAELGGVFKPEVRQDFIKSIQESLPGGESLTSKTSVFKDILDVAESRKSQPLTLEGLEQLDKELTDLKFSLVHPNGMITDEGRKIAAIQNSLRESAAKASEDSVVGGKEGYKALQDGINNWAISRKIYDIEKIFSNAELTDNPATSIKAGFRNMYKNDKKLIGYTAKEKELIKRAGKSSAVGNILRTTIGSRLISGMGGLAGGGLTGAAVSVPVSAAARGLATSMQKARGEDVLRELGTRIRR